MQTDFCVAVDTNRYSVSPRHLGKPATVLVYADRLEIVIEGEVAARHELCQERHQRRTLPEHEDEFKRSAPSRRLLEQAFIRLGPVATTYYEGLRAQRGRGAGHHMQRILKLCDRCGSEAVCGAMAHAARFGSYGADAVARVLSGRELPRLQQQGDPPPGPPPPPERVRRWLEAIHVEDSDLDEYDRLIDERSGGIVEEGDDDE